MVTIKNIFPDTDVIIEGNSTSLKFGKSKDKELKGIYKEALKQAMSLFNDSPSMPDIEKAIGDYLYDEFGGTEVIEDLAPIEDEEKEAGVNTIY